MPTLPHVLITDEHGARVGQEELPPFVQTQAHLDRWRLCMGIAERMTGEHESSQHVWMAARELFHSDIPTEEPSSVMQLQGDEPIEEAAQSRRKQWRNRLGRWIDMPDLPKVPSLRDEKGTGERYARIVLDTIGVDPYDVDLDKLAAHARAHESDNPQTRVPGPGSPCYNFRKVDFAVHLWLPALIREKYPDMAQRLMDTSPRWGKGAHGTSPMMPPLVESEALALEEARRRPQRRDRRGRWADMPDVPKPAPPQRRTIRRRPMPPLSPGVQQLELEAADLTFQPPSEFALSVLKGHEDTHQRYLLKRQPAASPGYDPQRHPVYAAHRARKHRQIIGATLAVPVEALLGGQHPSAAKLRRGELLTEPEKDEVRAAARRMRAGGSPHALFSAGGPASGKTTLLDANPELKPSFAAEIDADDIKKELWEFGRLARAKDHYAARAVHRESGDIAARLYDEATSMNLNVVVDGTGNNPPGDFVAELRRARSAGYDVDIIYVDRPTDEAVAFALERARRGGRFVPIPVVRAQHRAVSRNFRDEVSRLDWVRVDVFDQTGHIAAHVRGRTTVFDDEQYARFLAKADEHGGERGA